MKLLNVSFYPIKKEELEFVKYRHQHDKEIFSAFGEEWQVIHVKLLSEADASRHNTENEKYFRGRPGFFNIPWELINYVKEQKPDIVFMHSFLFPVQFLALRRMVGKKTKFIVQHHAEAPFKNFLKSFLQRLAFSNTSLFLFAAPELSVPFISRRVIGDPDKVMQLMEVSSMFDADGKAEVPKHHDHATRPTFLWVGRLDDNKDPLTVIDAFALYMEKGNDFRLYMLFGSAPLEEEVKMKIRRSNLDHHVILLGRRPHKEVEHWMHQADYYISASHREGSGVALSEAMACGCVPIVTDIPSFRAMTRNGDCAYLYEPGDVKALATILEALPDHPEADKIEKAKMIFKEDLSPHAISRALCAAVNSLTRR